MSHFSKNSETEDLKNKLTNKIKANNNLLKPEKDN